MSKIIIKPRSCLCFSIVIFFIFFTRQAQARYLSSYEGLNSESQAPNSMFYKNYIESGNHYLENGLYDQAKAYFWQAVEADSTNPDAYVNIGITHIQLKEYDNAIRLLKQAQELAPEEYFQNEILFYNLGLAYYLQGDYQTAIDHLSRALKEHPLFAQALVYLGLSYQAQGDNESAFLSIFEARYMIEKSDDRPFLSLVETKLKEISQQPGIDTVSLGQKFYEQGKIMLAQGDDLDKARYMFEESVFLNPGYTDAYYQLALLYSRTNAPHNAIAYLARIIEADPANLNAHMSLGYAYRDLRHYDKALAYFEKALEISPDNATIIYDIGVTYLEEGKTNSGEKYLAASRKIALQEKNLFLVEKIDSASKGAEVARSAADRPFRIKKTVAPKESKQSLPIYQPVSGNAGGLAKGYFIPTKTLQEPKDQKKPRVLLQQY